MSSRVVFIDMLPTELRELVEPHHVLIAGGMTERNIFRELFFAYGEENYDRFLRDGGTLGQEIKEFVEACMDWLDNAGSEGADIHCVFKGVAKDILDSEATTSLVTEYLTRLVQNAIANNQPLPQE